MTIRGELKKLVTKLGGTPSKEDQTAELIHKVTDNVSGGGLAVVFRSTDMQNFTADKTFAEVLSAYNSLVPVYGYIELPNGSYTPLTVRDTDAAEYIAFGQTSILTGDNELDESLLMLNNDESVIFRQDRYTLTPKT